MGETAKNLANGQGGHQFDLGDSFGKVDHVGTPRGIPHALPGHLHDEVADYYREILGKTGGPPPDDKEIKATCWALVTKLFTVIFQEVHPQGQSVRCNLGNVNDDTAWVNGLFLYAALEKLWVLRDFVAHQYLHHPKYNNQVVEHLFNISIPHAVYEKGLGSGSSGGSFLIFNRINTSLSKHKVGINRLEMAVGSIHSHLQLPGCQ